MSLPCVKILYHETYYRNSVKNKSNTILVLLLLFATYINTKISNIQMFVIVLNNLFV